jgi:hypothetical protein
MGREASEYWIPRFGEYEGNKLSGAVPMRGVMKEKRNCSTICRKSLVAFSIG